MCRVIRGGKMRSRLTLCHPEHRLTGWTSIMVWFSRWQYAPLLEQQLQLTTRKKNKNEKKSKTKRKSAKAVTVHKHRRRHSFCSNSAPKPCCSLSHRVVEAWARMFPPIGFLGSAENMAAPSTCATTWLVITTATPNWTTGMRAERSRVCPLRQFTHLHPLLFPLSPYVYIPGAFMHSKWSILLFSLFKNQNEILFLKKTINI